jgi:hypothetical protein
MVGSLDAAVLVAERDLELEDVLAVALEAEVAGLDDAGVHRPDRDLVDRLALDAAELAHADHGTLAGLAPEAEGAGSRGERLEEAQRVEIGVAEGLDAVLLGDLALEQVHLRGARRERAEEAAVEPGGVEREPRVGVVGEHRPQLDGAAGGRRLVPEERGHPLAGGDPLGEQLAEARRRQCRHGRAADARPVAHARRGVGLHGRPTSR